MGPTPKTHYFILSKCRIQILQDTKQNLQDSRIFKAEKAGQLATMIIVVNMAIRSAAYNKARMLEALWLNVYCKSHSLGV